MALSAKDLRIGNLIYNIKNEFEKRQIIVSGITNTMIACKQIVTEHKFFEPIPLSEEWLLKAGFNKQSLSGIHNCFVIKRKNNYHFTLYESENSYNINNRMLEVDIKYVHQLQNLYLALTGEELVFSN